jgi:hypothetical protein
MLINPDIRTRTRHFRRAYHPTRDTILTVVDGVDDFLSLQKLQIRRQNESIDLKRSFGISALVCFGRRHSIEVYCIAYLGGGG